MFKQFSTFENFVTFVNGYNNHPIPLEFSNSLTTSEFLHELLGYLHDLMENQSKVYKDIYNELVQKFNQLENDILHSDKLLKYFTDEIMNFAKLLIDNLMEKSLKHIVFEITDDGYFVAYVPDNLQQIRFNTIIDPSSKDYGKLILEY